MSQADLLIVFYAMIGGAIRVSTPFLFVALGECLTKKSGRINLGLEGNLIFGAIVAYAVSYNSGSPWFGVLAAGCAGVLLGAAHGWICKLPSVNDIAVGLAFMSLGTCLAFFFGKPYIQPSAPRLETLPMGGWSGNPHVQQALQVNPLFFVGIVLAIAMWWALRNTRAGLTVRMVRMVGDSAASRQGDGGEYRHGAPVGHNGGRLSGGCGRRLPVAVLSRQLE